MAFAPVDRPDGTSLVSAALENGSVLIFQFRIAYEGDVLCICEWEKTWQAEAFQEHGAAVLRLAWQKPIPGERLLLASGGEDHAVQIFEVDF